MEFFEVIKKRHSVRSYQSKDVCEKKLNKLFEIINSAPSAGNLQAYEIVVVKNNLVKERLASAAYGQHWLTQAPVLLIFFQNVKRSEVKYGKRGELYSLQDATIAAAYSQLGATSLNLGSCWVGAFDEERVKEILNAPKYLRPIAIISIGYPRKEGHKSSRRSLKDLFKFEKFSS